MMEIAARLNMDLKTKVTEFGKYSMIAPDSEQKLSERIARVKNQISK